jgi:hypothetical protein
VRAIRRSGDWSVQKRARRVDISPLARGIFAIFFVHRPFEAVDRGARATGIAPTWKHSAQVTSYALLVLASRVIERLSSDMQTTFAIASNAMSLLPLVTAQRVANLANSRSVVADEDEDDQEQADLEA